VFSRYHVNMGVLLAAVKAALKWADGAEVKRELDKQILELLGPKTEQDLAKPDKKKKKVVSAGYVSADSHRLVTPLLAGFWLKMSGCWHSERAHHGMWLNLLDRTRRRLRRTGGCLLQKPPRGQRTTTRPGELPTPTPSFPARLKTTRCVSDSVL
jgi:hypothetical protein